jgi:ATP-dependent DNA ligase
VPAGSFVLDGELAIPVDGKLSFDELQLRLHPAASRVQKLANSHPAIFIVFDLLAEDRERYLKRPLRERRILLEEFVRENLGSIEKIRLSPPTSDLAVATKWFDKVGGDLDGLVAKQIDAAYASGERTAAVKIKQIRTADCVVGGFRYASGEKILGSLLLGSIR